MNPFTFMWLISRSWRRSWRGLKASYKSWETSHFSSIKWPCRVLPWSSNKISFLSSAMFWRWQCSIYLLSCSSVPLQGNKHSSEENTYWKIRSNRMCITLKDHYIKAVSDQASWQRIVSELKQMNALLMLTCFCWAEEEISAMLSLPHWTVFQCQ